MTGEDRMTVSAYLRGLSRRWWVVAIIALLTGGSAFAATKTEPKSYSAVAELYFGTTYGKSATDLSQGTTFTQSHVASYAGLIDTPMVLEPVLRDLGLNESVKSLAQQVTASATRDTVLVDVSATASSAQGAADLANSAAKHLAEAARTLAPKDSSGNSTVAVTSVSPGVAPQVPAGPAVVRNSLTALISGLLLALVIEFFIGSVLLRRQVTASRARLSEESHLVLPVRKESGSDEVEVEPKANEDGEDHAVGRLLPVPRRPVTPIAGSYPTMTPAHNDDKAVGAPVAR